MERTIIKPDFSLKKAEYERKIVKPEFAPQGTEERERKIVKPEFDFPGKGWSPSGESGTKILITDVAASEFDVASKWAKLDADGFLLLEQVIGNLPGYGEEEYSLTVVSKTTHYTAADKEAVLVDATSGNLDISLPAAVLHTQIVVKKTDSSTHTVTIVTPGAETIEGEANLVISAQYTSYTVICDGTNWFII